MSRVLALVEGPTERAVIEQIFAPDLGAKNVFIYPRVVGKPGYKGGNTFDTVRKELRALLRQEPQSMVTMFFDYYGLRGDWPGLKDTKGKEPVEILSILRQGIHQALLEDVGQDIIRNRFIPYIQIHEMESLLFAGPEHMAAVFEKPGLKNKFSQIVTDCGGCEKINDNADTAPSKRIQKVFPSYRKGSSVNAHAYRITQRTGIERIRQQCPNFNEWYTILEQSGS